MAAGDGNAMHLICGEALYDVFVNGESHGAGGEVALQAVPGGSPFNVAIGMARLGRQVGFASDLATDFLGDRIAAQLVQEGVSDMFLRRSATTTALAIVATDEVGKPSYSFSGLEQAIYCPVPESINQHEKGISGIHVGSIATVLPNSSVQLCDLVRRFADRALISFDPNIRLSVVPDHGVWRQAIEHIRPFCHVVKVSEEDIATLFADVDQDALCRSWLGDRTALVALTKGPDGAVLFTRGAGRITIPLVETVVADTVGAGDSFMAALLSMLIRMGWVSSEAIAQLDAEQLRSLGSFAALAASVTCSRRGPVLPTSSELEPLTRR